MAISSRSEPIDVEMGNKISGGIFIIGLGVLFMTHYFWPGIMFVIGVTLCVQAFVEGRGFWGSQGALWCLGLGVVFAMGANGGTLVGLLLVVVGLSSLSGAFVKPAPIFNKPHVDNTLE